MKPPRRPRLTLLLLRVAAAVHALAVFTQPVLAGLYLSGDFDVLGVHSGNAILVVLLGLIQLIAAVLYWTLGGGRGRPVLLALLLVLAEPTQTAFGFARVLAVHIPLGVAIVTATAVLLGWVFRPAAGEARPARESRR